MAMGKKNVVGILCGLSLLGFACAFYCMFAGTKAASASVDNMWDIYGKKQGEISITETEVERTVASYDVYCEDPVCPKAVEIKPPCGNTSTHDRTHFSVSGHYLVLLCTINIKDPVVGVIKITAPKNIYVMQTGWSGASKRIGEAVGGIGAFFAGFAGMVCCVCCGAVFFVTGLCFMLFGNDASAGAREVRVEGLARDAVQYNLLH
eukprot:TRINITY_DN8206_c0_g1_i1.p1 TRINITY_DN8206_c0_g1~~TRINITY_DN8206_c0_g1_i1.p1  ORF type:complete len:227 (-),score=25.18 TRINITY_DN8206_c0_g1_i1:195-812(-)